VTYAAVGTDGVVAVCVHITVVHFQCTLIDIGAVYSIASVTCSAGTVEAPGNIVANSISLITIVHSILTFIGIIAVEAVIKEKEPKETAAVVATKYIVALLGTVAIAIPALIDIGTVEAVSSEPGPTAAGIAARSVAAFSHLLTVTHVSIQVAFIDICAYSPITSVAGNAGTVVASFGIGTVGILITTMTAFRTLIDIIASPAVCDIETESIETRASVASNGVVADMVTWQDFILTLIDI
jgi:sorbitol-specific phosphotransferase system component IIC